MTFPMSAARDDHAALVSRVADRVLDHPAVGALHGGQYGTVATHLPGRRLIGVRVDETDGSVQVCVVARLGASLPDLAEQLRARVRALAGPMQVHVTIGDLTVDDDQPGRMV